MISSGGGDADDGVDSALGEPGSGGEFSVHRSWESKNGPDAITCTSTRYASSPKFTVLLKFSSAVIDSPESNESSFHQIVPRRYPHHIKTAISSDNEQRSRSNETLQVLNSCSSDDRSLSSRFTR